MTQYYEPEARELESRANQSNDPAEQNRLWAEAARIGTVVELDENGDEIWPNPNARAQKRLVDIGRVQAMVNEFPDDAETHCQCGRALPCRHCARGVETCARCGHQTLGCPRCGKNDPFLGAGWNDTKYCHTFSAEYPTCYMHATRNDDFGAFYRD